MRHEQQKCRFDNRVGSSIQTAKIFLYLWLLIPTMLFLFKFYFINEDDRE